MEEEVEGRWYSLLAAVDSAINVVWDVAEARGNAVVVRSSERKEPEIVEIIV